MNRRLRLLCPLWLLGTLFALTLPAWAQAPADGPARFKGEIDAFRAWDAKNSVPPDAVLFVGSSTIRLWTSAEAFPGFPVINRGFGGSQIPDVNHYIQDVALKYRPAAIVFYAGDNDVHSGRTAEQVLADYREFVAKVHAARADTRIIFLAIKPSPARWEKWPAMREANERIRAFGETYNRNRSAGQLLYVDVASPMLTSDGRTQAHLYVEDGLHLSDAGYAMWNKVLAPVLEQTRRP
jgi:lysophospholipase L1-like esterase